MYDEAYLKDVSYLFSVCDEGRETVKAVEMPFNDWAAQIKLYGSHQSTFEDGVTVMTTIGKNAGEKRSNEYATSVLSARGSEW